MSEIEKKVITDDLEIIEFFRILHKTKEKLWIWQNATNEQGERPVHFCLLRKLDILKKNIELTPLSEDGFSFQNKDNDLFLYSRKKNIAFKFRPRELEGHYIMLGFAEKLNHLSQELAAKINLVEEENEGKSKHLRQQPRKQAGDNQTVTLYKAGSESKHRHYDLYDISAGGLALKTPDPGMFAKDDFLTVLCINTNPLPQPIKGKVVSIRHMTDDDLFKVGVQFIKD
ncbi:MAG: PilZ domain-containing protein [Bacteriovoracaceae bacterium]|nr:PilZ domain-containing protein [Bacteriovoracaceae bacterium]